MTILNINITTQEGELVDTFTVDEEDTKGGNAAKKLWQETMWAVVHDAVKIVSEREED